MTLPNFIIIGAARSGTTSLYEYLRQHPDVAMSTIKETRYFAFEVEKDRAQGIPQKTLEEFYPVRTIDAYRRQFDHARERRAVGEATPRYQFIPGVAERIGSVLPDIRLIAILREPGSRAWAHHMAKSRLGRENRPFEDVIRGEIPKLDATPVVAGGGCLEQGLYHRNLKRYVETFSKERLLVLLQDDLRDDPAGTMRKIFRFLDIDENHPLDLTTRHAPAGMAKNQTLEKLMNNPVTTAIERRLPTAMLRAAHILTKPIRQRNTTRPTMSEEARQLLQTVFNDDITALEKLIDRDLSAWRG